MNESDQLEPGGQGHQGAKRPPKNWEVSEKITWQNARHIENAIRC